MNSHGYFNLLLPMVIDFVNEKFKNNDVSKLYDKICLFLSTIFNNNLEIPERNKKEIKKLIMASLKDTLTLTNLSPDIKFYNDFYEAYNSETTKNTNAFENSVKYATEKITDNSLNLQELIIDIRTRIEEKSIQKEHDINYYTSLATSFIENKIRNDDAVSLRDDTNMYLSNLLFASNLSVNERKRIRKDILVNIEEYFNENSAKLSKLEKFHSDFFKMFKQLNNQNSKKKIHIIEVINTIFNSLLESDEYKNDYDFSTSVSNAKDNIINVVNKKHKLNITLSDVIIRNQNVIY